MDVQLSVELTAKIDALRDGFNKATSETNKYSASTKKALKDVDKGFSDLANSVEKSIGKISTSTSKASSVTTKNLASIAAASAKTSGGVAVDSNKAAYALTNFGRVAQDLPFGFIGIQNNLNPLLESFQMLRKETGSNALAFKALGSALMGPAGIGIALSLASSALLLYQQYQQKSAKETANSEAAIKKAKKASEDYALSLDVITRARLLGAQSAQKDLTELSTLYRITQDVTLSTKQRAAAAADLQKTYPEYFANLTKEAILTGQAKDKNDELTVSIIATARARAAEDIITKNALRSRENDIKITDLQIAREKALTVASRLRRQAQADAGTSGTGSNIISLSAAGSAEAKVVEITKQINNLKTDTSILNSRNLSLEKEITEQVKKGADLSGKVGDVPKEKKEKNIKDLSDVLKDLNIDLLQIDNTFNSTFDENSVKKIDAYQKAIDELIKMGYKPASSAVIDLKEAQKDLFQLAPISRTGREIFAQVRDMKTIVDAMTGKESSTAVKSAPKKSGLMNDPSRFLGDGKTIRVAGAEISKEYQKILADQFKFEEEFKKGMESLTDSSMVASISGGFNAIGQAIAEGGDVFAAASQQLVGVIVGFMNELGELLIKKGAATIAAGVALNIITPGAGTKQIVGGGALMAAGALLSLGGGFVAGSSKKGGFEAPTAFAAGGIVSGPTMALAGEYPGARSNPEVIAPLDKLNSLISQTISNTLGVPSRSSSVGLGIVGKSMSVASNTVVISPGLAIKGNDLYVLVKKIEESRRRT